MECKRLPIDYEIKDFSLKMALLIQYSSLIVSLKRQKTHPMGRLVAKKKNFFNRKKLTILLLIIQYLIIVISLK